MNHSTSCPDVLPTVLSRYQELSQTPLARRLTDIRVGPTSLWDAVRYDVADAMYDAAYRELHTNEPPKSAATRGWVARNLWQAQLGQEFLVGLLSARLGLLGDLVESGFHHGQRLVARHRGGHRTDVLVAGSMHRRAVAALGPVLQRLEHNDGLRHLVVAHDDVLLRHARTFRGLGLRWRPAAVFSTGSHRTAARAIMDRARRTLADARVSERASLPAAVLRRSLSPRRVRRLAVNFLAVQGVLSLSDPSVVVIPDERQPLARLVGLEARRRGLPVVSAPLDRDQIYRKTPLWDRAISTRILVFSSVAARFLGRFGVQPDLFEVVRLVASNSAATRDDARVQSDDAQLLRLEPRTRIVLFASQGQSQNAILLPRLAACLRAIPGSALVIRPHPYEWPALVRLMNPGVHVSTAMTPRDAILAADVVVTHSSFMAVEAALLGRPVILVSPDQVPSLLPLLTEGLATWACTKEELHRALVDLLPAGDSRLRAAQERFRQEQAQAGGLEHAAAVIANLARTGRPPTVTPWGREPGP